ncbi:MAG TPA: HAMP domain-containing histidine kinase [Crenotrichaceae bacterium]|nr:HAMP domain-containing histidine kinase [Crenotrichaceae bacterium]
MSTLQYSLYSSEELISTSQKNQFSLKHSQVWQALRIYFFYRFTLALFLLWAVYTGKGPSLIAAYSPTLFTYSIIVYTILLGISFIPLHTGSYDCKIHAFYHLTLDLCCIPLLIHASGGIGSGLEALLLMSVAASGLLLGGIYSVGFAALCSLVFLGEAIYSDLYDIFENTHYTEASVLGICSFAVSLFAHSLGRRAEQSELLANQRGRDIERLEKLNVHIIQNLQSGVIIIDPVKGIQSINQSVLQFFKLEKTPVKLSGISAKLAESYQDWLSDQQHDSITLDGQHEAQILTRFIALETAGKPYHMIWFEDLSIETQRIQQAKLVSLGHLAASIAHEIRNPLSVISHASQLLEETPDLDTESKKMSQLIIRHASRVNKIIDNILQLAQRKPACLEEIELIQWVDNFIVLFQEDYHTGNNKLYFTHPHSSSLKLRVDPSQLRQILTNLCSNAIKHSVKSSQADVEIIINEIDDKVTIDVSDAGPGIPEQYRDRLFDPFFTTSETGTGLGLYICRELSELNQGWLDYFPRPEGGSVFRLSFPKYRQKVISI